MKYLVKIEDLKKKTEFLENEIDNIKDYVNNLKDAKKILIWEGTARNKFDEKYDAYIEELNSMLKGLIKILLYYKSFYSNYDDEYKVLKNKYKDLLGMEDKDELY